jgi:hypothetical protein
MFKLVDPTLPSTLKDVLSPAVVDVQLVGDHLASDEVFIRDRSVEKDAASGVYTYVALRDAIPQQQMSRIREFVFCVLSRLSRGARFMCFMTGSVPDSDVRELEYRLVIRAHHEGTRMNGVITIAEMDGDELAYSMGYLGNFDAMRGVALTPEGMKGMYADLRLFEPMPTADDNGTFQPPTYNAMRIALEHGVFFFQEINNGTQSDLAREVEEIIEEKTTRA